MGELSPGLGSDGFSIQATGIHADNCVILSEHFGGSKVASRLSGSSVTPPRPVATGQGRCGRGCRWWCVQTQLWGPAADSWVVAGPFADRHAMAGAPAGSRARTSSGALAAVGAQLLALNTVSTGLATRAQQLETGDGGMQAGSWGGSCRSVLGCRPDAGPQTAVGTLAIGGLSRDCSPSLTVKLQWRPVTVTC